MAVTGLWARLLLIHQRNSVGIVDSEWRGVKEGVDVRRGVRVQGCQEGGSVRGDGKEVSLAELF